VETSPEPIVERASSKLKVSATTALYAATKPKARSTMGFVLLAAQIMRYVGGDLGTTLLHEQAKAGNVGELLERGG
jgi:hypothetical protein